MLARKILPLILAAAALTGCGAAETSEKQSIEIAVAESETAEGTKTPTVTKWEAGLDSLYDANGNPSDYMGVALEEEVEPTVEPTPEPEPTAVEVEAATEEVVEVVEVQTNSSSSGTLADIGAFTVTFYCPCAEHCNGSVGALGVELTPWYSIALPDYSYLGRTFYVDGFGYFRCEDVSPAGICDIFVSHHSEIPSYGMTTAYLWEVTG